MRSAAASNAYELGYEPDNLYVGVSVNNKKREKKIASTKLNVLFLRTCICRRIRFGMKIMVLFVSEKRSFGQRAIK